MEMEAALLTVTLFSLVIAVGASVFAWRVLRAERLRSEARIAALAADLQADEGQPRTHQHPAADPVELTFKDAPVAAAAGMFAEKPRQRSGFRLAGAIGVAAVIVAAVIGSLVMTSESPSAPAAVEPTTAADPAAAAPTAAAPADVQLELIALGHEREADRLTVRGIVRGTAPAPDQRPLTAVVLLYSREGTFLTSARAEVQSAGDPAGERKFVVTVPSPGDVGRYRVSFRSDDHVVPHVDRRAQAGTAASEAGNARSQI
jgi:hypothetical protein